MDKGGVSFKGEKGGKALYCTVTLVWRVSLHACTLLHVSTILTMGSDFPQFVQINLATISSFLVLCS